MNIQEIIREHIEEENLDLKYKIGDRLERIQFNMTPTIAYDYLLTDINNQYSFLHPDLNKCQCEDLPGKSDYAIYFEKISSFCKKTFNEILNQSDYKEHIHEVKMNQTVRDLLQQIFKRRITSTNLPNIWQFALYTNKKDNRAPRILFFIGNLGIIYILAFDQWHKTSLMGGK